MISELINRSLKAQLTARLRQECWMQVCNREDMCGGCDLRAWRAAYADTPNTDWQYRQLLRLHYTHMENRIGPA